MRLLGIFAKHAVPGSVKTRLALDIGPQAAAELCDAFLHDLTARFGTTADRRWLAYTPVTPESRDWFAHIANGWLELWPQPEADLGTRIEEFFAAAMIAGATQVVLIGSDSPTLPVNLVEQAFSELDKNDAVLGPARDGGYYLIGLKQIWLGLLQGVRWSTPHALADTLQRLRCAEFRTAMLPAWTDIDTGQDLQRLRTEFTDARKSHPDAAWSLTERWLDEYRGVEGA